MASSCFIIVSLSLGVWEGYSLFSAPKCFGAAFLSAQLLCDSSPVATLYCSGIPGFSGPTPSSVPAKNLRERRNTDLPLLDVHTLAREEGEGMETTDTESVSSASTYLPSLEQLLNTPDTKLGKECFCKGHAISFPVCTTSRAW